jgi:hypothetical protein
MISLYGNPLNSACGCIQMAVTSVVVTKKVHMSRRWKAELVGYRIHKQPLASFAHLLPLKPDRSLICSEVFSTSSWLQNHVAIKPCNRIDRMGNQKKAEFVNGNFGIQSFWGGSVKFCQNLDLGWKVESARILIQQAGRVSDSRNS